MRPVLDPVAQDVDDAALADLALQPGEELLARRAVLIEIEGAERGGWVAAMKARNWTRSTVQARS